jgi:hypothetical protein
MRPGARSSPSSCRRLAFCHHRGRVRARIVTAARATTRLGRPARGWNAASLGRSPCGAAERTPPRGAVCSRRGCRGQPRRAVLRARFPPPAVRGGAARRRAAGGVRPSSRRAAAGPGTHSSSSASRSFFLGGSALAAALLPPSSMILSGCLGHAPDSSPGAHEPCWGVP